MMRRGQAMVVLMGGGGGDLGGSGQGSQQGNYGPPQPGYGAPPPPGYGPQQPYPPQGYPPQQQWGPAPAAGAKQSIVAGLLGIFLGAWGVHEFYLGNKMLGIVHVCLAGGGLLLFIIGTALPAVMFTSGNFGGAVGMTMLTPVLVGLGWMAIMASWIWGIVTGIMCLTKSGKYARDANGVLLA